MSESKFNCYQSKNAVETPLLAPTPCCGITAPPAGFRCDLIIAGSCTGTGFAEGTYNDIVLVPVSKCSTTYYNSNCPISILFEPAFCTSKNGYKSPPVGHDYSGVIVSGPTGSCYIENGITKIGSTITVDLNGGEGEPCYATLNVKDVIK